MSGGSKSKKIIVLKSVFLAFFVQHWQWRKTLVLYNQLQQNTPLNGKKGTISKVEAMKAFFAKKNTLSIFYSKIPSNYVKVSITYCAMLRLVTNLVEPRYRHFLMATTYPPNWICMYLLSSNIEVLKISLWKMIAKFHLSSWQS